MAFGRVVIGSTNRRVESNQSALLSRRTRVLRSYANEDTSTAEHSFDDVLTNAKEGATHIDVSGRTRTKRFTSRRSATFMALEASTTRPRGQCELLKRSTFNGLLKDVYP